MTKPARQPPPSDKQVYTAQVEQWITLIVLGIVVVGCYLVLQPFLSAVLWAIILCCTTWPVFMHLQTITHRRNVVSASLMTFVIAVVVLAPFVIVGMTLAESSDQLFNLWRKWMEEGPPEPPAWVGQLPIIGERLQAYWSGFAHDTAGLMAELKNYLQPLKTFALASGAALAQGIVQLTLSILIAFFLYRDGEAMSLRLISTVERIAGKRGTHLVGIAAGTMRGVVYGILGTALAQGVLAGFGLWLAGVPGAPLLGLLTFFLSPVPVGPPLVWIPAAIWLFTQGATGWGIFLLVWGVGVVSMVDNFVKPMIISRGSNLPFILVLLGILGGVIAFGFIGIFLGPTLLAIGFALLEEWSAERSKSSEAT